MKRILVLDDSIEARTLISRMLQGLAEIICVSSVGEAYAALQENPPDAALVDLVLPTSSMQGDDFAELLWRAGVPTAIVTSSPELARRNAIPVIEKYNGVRAAAERLLKVRTVQFGSLHPQPSAA